MPETECLDILLDVPTHFLTFTFNNQFEKLARDIIVMRKCIDRAARDCTNFTELGKIKDELRRVPFFRFAPATFGDKSHNLNIIHDDAPAQPISHCA